MRGVRKSELAQGKKRTTGRENIKRESSEKSPDKTPRRMDRIAVKEERASPNVNEMREKLVSLAVNGAKESHLSTTGTTRGDIILRSWHARALRLSPGGNLIDPFNSLPSSRIPPQMVDGLLKYCNHHSPRFDDASDLTQALIQCSL